MTPELKQFYIDAVTALAIHITPVGSRVTCNPPPIDTDEDHLILLEDNTDKWRQLCEWLFENGWTRGGSLEAGVIEINKDDKFESWTFDELNFIITCSEIFYHRFMAATHVAKRLNLMDKPDRIALFQAVLYANQVD